MALFKRWKLNEKTGAAEYRQEGSTVSMRCSEGLWDGEAPMEIHVTAPNLAPVPERKGKTAKTEPKAKATKAKGKK
jgi:hypothetical protein